MKILKNRLFILLILLISFFTMTKIYCKGENKMQKYIASLSGDKVISKILFDELVEENKSEENRILFIAAENDTKSNAAYNLGSYYEMYSEKSPLNILRSEFWFYMSGNSENQDFKISDKDYSNYEKIDNKLFDEMCRESMLGNKSAPWILYLNSNKNENYLDCGTDFNPEVNNKAYWLRIGAQNGNTKCQKEYGLLLKSEKNKDSNLRGDFWIKKVNEKL